VNEKKKHGFILKVITCNLLTNSNILVLCCYNNS